MAFIQTERRSKNSPRVKSGDFFFDFLFMEYPKNVKIKIALKGGDAIMANKLYNVVWSESSYKIGEAPFRGTINKITWETYINFKILILAVPVPGKVIKWHCYNERWNEVDSGETR